MLSYFLFSFFLETKLDRKDKLFVVNEVCKQPLSLLCFVLFYIGF